MSELIAVIGDLVASRSRTDQAALLEAAATQFRAVNQIVPATQDLSPTVGDEFQGVFATIESALLATLLVQLRLLAYVGIEARFGMAQGTVTVTKAADPPFAQSGTAWWEARAALSDLNDKARGWPRTARAAYRGGNDVLINGFLTIRDELMANFDERDAKATLGLFSGERQDDIADQLGVSQPAVSQRIHRGPLALYVAHQRMEAP